MYGMNPPGATALLEGHTAGAVFGYKLGGMAVAELGKSRAYCLSRTMSFLIWRLRARSESKNGIKPLGNDPFAGRLLNQEKLVWSGRPRQGIMLTARDIFLIPFSLLWGGFAMFWEAMVLSTKAPSFMAIFGVPFVLVGLFLIFGRLPFDAWLRSKLMYGLTDRRVLIQREGPWASFKALGLDRLPEATLIEGSDGRGTIRFAPPTSFLTGYGRGAGLWIPALDPAAQFLGIADVRRVFDLVQKHVQGAPRA